MLSRITVQLMGLILEKADFLVPLRKLASNEFWLAYRHPKPAYTVHLLILPRKAWKNVFDCPVDDPQVMTALLTLIKTLIREQKLEEIPCRLVINGGKYQSAPIVHAHLTSI